MRKEYVMTEEQLQKLMDACKPVPYMKITGWQSQQQNADRAWHELGIELGFKSETVEPVEGKGSQYFTAEEIES